MTTRLGNAPVRRVALLATGERDAALLTMMVERMLVGKFRIGEAGSADVAIIDADAANGREALAKWRAMHPSAPCVLLGLKPPTDLARESGVAYVRKPISIPDLIHALLDLAGRIEANRPPRLDVAALRPSAPVPSCGPNRCSRPRHPRSWRGIRKIP